jgi:hypothetical protein
MDNELIDLVNAVLFSEKVKTYQGDATTVSKTALDDLRRYIKKMTTKDED